MVIGAPPGRIVLALVLASARASPAFPPPAPPESLTEYNMGNYRNDTHPGATLPGRESPPADGHADFVDYAYFVDWVSSPTLAVRWLSLNTDFRIA